MQRAAITMSRFLVIVLLSGLFIRLTVGDTFHLTGVIFYATPPAAMTLMLLFTIAFPPGSPKTRWLAVAFLPLMIAWTWTSQYCNGTPPSEQVSNVQRLLFWNVCEGKPGWGPILQTIESQDADIILLAEAETLMISEHRTELLQDYETLRLPGRMLLLSRIPVLKGALLADTGHLICGSARLQTESGPISVVAADIKSSLAIHRKAPIYALTAIVQSQSDPGILMGDLNTPVDSRFLSMLRGTHINAFEAAGQGLHATWPMPLPVMAIDHVWGSAEVRFIRTKILWTVYSDHRPVVADFTVVSAD